MPKAPDKKPEEQPEKAKEMVGDADDTECVVEIAEKPVAGFKPTTPTKPTKPTKPKPRENPVPVHNKKADPSWLVFTPRAWAKVTYMRDRGKSEVSGFGISHPDDPFLITDFRLVEQVNTPTFTKFIDNALAHYLEDMVIDEKILPARCIRVWIHTHPSMSPNPSHHDEETFRRVNANSTWGVMCIVSDKKEYARLRVNNAEGMSGQKELDVHMDMHVPFEGVTDDDYKAWEEEYCRLVSFGVSSTAVEDIQSWRMRSMGGYDDDVEWASPGGTELSDEDALDIDELLNSEVVCIMREEPDGWFYVYTEQYWLRYGAEQEVICDLHETLMGTDCVSHHDPYDWGNIVWRADSHPDLFTKGGDEYSVGSSEHTSKEAFLRGRDDELSSDVPDPRSGYPAAGHCVP